MSNRAHWANWTNWANLANLINWTNIDFELRKTPDIFSSQGKPISL